MEVASSTMATGKQEKSLAGEQTTLSLLAKECWNAFDEISDLIENSWNAFARISLLASSQLTPGSTFTPADFNDEYEQFRVWTKNLGVLATDQASLDYRLREAEHVKGNLASLLRRLLSHLRGCRLLLTKDQEKQSPVAEDELSSESSESEPDAESSPQSSSTYELRARLEDIAELVNKLVKLSIAIRASGVRSRWLRATTYQHWEDGVNESEIFERIYLPQVLRLRFGLKDPILRRLCGAISNRRRLFLYQRRHEQTLAYGADALELRRTQRQSPHLGALSKAGSEASFPKSPQQKVDLFTCDTAGNSLLQPPTKATTFRQVALDTANKSSIASGSKRASNLEGVEIPPPPTVGVRARHFQCPYCCLLVPRKKAELPRWRQHVLADLQPYICIEPECFTPDKIFETEEDWYEHQCWQHALEWWCDGDGSEHVPQQFSSQDEFAMHLRTNHKSVRSEAGISRISKLSAKPSLTPFSCCPFCDSLPSDLMSNSNLAEQDTMEHDATHLMKKAQAIFRKHILDHLIQFFLIALPDRPDIEELGSETTGSRHARSSALDLQDVALIYSDEDVEDVISSPVAQNESVLVGNWDFVEIELVARSLRKAYAGHENDHVLKPFINRLTTVSSPSNQVVLPPPMIVLTDPNGFVFEIQISEFEVSD
ncbi:hypothetical protein GJ744_002190 [Endocarpon pusillum]|uniref:Oxidoreductase acuF-like C2H2 type zinc-finger domain-containing protein n=1 Tax=Endocarpon pusillum TaxID=364733 RepID=A0A8H7A8E5_9EURO|nr:hypothetical protein GJ744_002190 [Endocarpon pusillum]